jgi:hypothetical protein
MKAWRDMFGGDIIYTDEIDSATNDDDLKAVLLKYEGHLESMASDALYDLNKFGRELFT